MAFTGLEIGKRALNISQYGLEATSNNIANVNTPGYSRRSALISETAPLLRHGNFVGTGAIVNGLKSYRDDFIDREIRYALSAYSGHSKDTEVASLIESILTEPSDLGIGTLMNQFFTKFEDLSIHPESVALRQMLLQDSVTIAERFNYIAHRLSDARRDVFSSMERSVNDANLLLKDIAELNGLIMSTRTSSSGDSQTYIDQRAVKLDKLAELFHIDVAHNDNGAVNVYIDGINIVTDKVYSKIELSDEVNSETGERTAVLNKINLETGSKTNLTPRNGEMAASLEHYNIMLNDKYTGNDLSIALELNKYASTFAEKINSLLETGYGLDDNTAPPSGRILFVPTDGTLTAFNISVNQELLNSPRDLPLSDAPGEGGNSKIALAIARLAQDTDFLNNMTPTEYYASLIGTIGNWAKEANINKSTSRLVKDQLESNREALIGVNLDEEAINLVKYQKAFEAASRIVNTTNDILGIIINLGK